MMKILDELYAYREMIISLVHRDLKGRYKNSVLGFAWTFVNPLLQLAVYTVVFSTIMKMGIRDYYLLLFVALVPWIFFSTCVVSGCNCVLEQGDMVKKIYFPREVLPVAFVTSQFINMLLSFIVVFAVLILSGKGMNPTALLFLPLIMIIEYFLALGMTLLFSALTVFFRDLSNILAIVVMAWQWATPVMYPAEIIPAQFQTLMAFNPMYAIIVAYRQILYYKEIPDIHTLISAVVMGVVLLVAGELVFSRKSKIFADYL